MTSAYARIQRFLREQSGLSLDDDKCYLVENRLAPVLRAAGLSTLDELAQVVCGEPRGELARIVAETLTINETSFFRDRGLFAAFAETVLPGLMAARAEQRGLRIWCAGCSSGQEPYSLAMVLDEQARKLSGWRVEILATDLSRTVIETARRGSYSQFEVQRGVPVALLLRYFRRDGDLWQISDHLRAKTTFRAHNLVAGVPDLGPFDAIFCRNVLIYFDVATKQRVLASLHGSLADDGYLALGGAESVGGLSDGLAAVPGQRFLFQKRAGPFAREPRLRLVHATA